MKMQMQMTKAAKRGSQRLKHSAALLLCAALFAPAGPAAAEAASAAVSAAKVPSSASCKKAQEQRLNLSTDPTAWLLQQIEEAHAKFDYELEQSAVKRLIYLSPDDLSYKIEYLRLRMLNAAPRSELNALVDEICSKGSQEQCRSARFVADSKYAMLSKMLEQLNSFNADGPQNEEVYARLERDFDLTALDNNTRLELYRFMLKVPSMRAQAEQELKAMSEGRTTNLLFATRAEPLYHQFVYNRALDEAMAGLYEGTTRAASLTHLKALYNKARNDEERAYLQSLIDDASYWQLIADGDEALKRGQSDKARALYLQAGALRDYPYEVYLSAGALEASLGHIDKALAQYQKALSGAGAVERSELHRRMQSLYYAQAKARWQALQQAGSSADPTEVDALLTALAKYARAPWEIYTAAKAYQSQGLEDKALALFAPYTEKQDYLYSYALLLSSLHRDADAQAAAEKCRNPQCAELRDSLALQRDYRAAVHLYQEGEVSAAYQALLPLETKLEPYMRQSLASIALELGHKEKARALYTELTQRPDFTASAKLQLTLLALKDSPQAGAHALDDLLQQPKLISALSINELIELTTALQEQGRSREALKLFALASPELDAQGHALQPGALLLTQQSGSAGPDAQILPADTAAPVLTDDAARAAAAAQEYRARPAAVHEQEQQSTSAAAASDRVRLEREYAQLLSLMGSPEDALSVYQRAFYHHGLINTPKPDDVTFTHAMLIPDEYTEGDWLTPSLTQRAAELYEQQSVRLEGGTYYKRDSCEGGYSDLTGLTTTLQLVFPIGKGQGRIITDAVYLDSGSLGTSPYDSKFGRCYASGCDGSAQDDFGTALAFAYADDKFSFDFGTAPQGFVYDDDYLFGAGYDFEIGEASLGLEVYRRAVTGSQLSFAGQSADGVRFGAVRRSGAALNLSIDRGERHGIWAQAAFEHYSGHKVDDNDAVKLMGGWYQRLINQNNREWRTGLTAMYWHFEQDLSGYTIGQGGYYSPQHYLSVGPNTSWRERSENWSYVVDASVSLSWSKTEDNQRYPLAHLAEGLPDRDAVEDGDSSAGIFGRLYAAGMVRLSPRLTLGAELTLQHADGYSPLYAGIFFTFYFDEWAGSLPLPVEPVLPWTER